ncbi:MULTISPECIES: HlyD family secretion protein [unclassified Shewanella]|jgi:membrane fusion protein (multidrug efflux system)|uniref:HlyD family secretion protein n=3 Tax=Alteromonadales TaxID=135622 RepID=UPI000C345BA0|nr:MULTISPECIES: HlyD family secretion protein [unclassified Shewanella]MBB1361158.1 HlyD family secretion protein [Shewanella sp. SR44-4]MBO1896412.1 HlyD family secretion protein [Shewanella sp. BF02_Schw]PKH33875.1 HlyD family secretion protein [Shewanella sp. ALD9]QHS12113.1 HlyD family secretion protein [Shewanella sp. Arc9-LZ]
MSINKRLVLVPGIIVVLVVAGVYWWSQVRYIESTDNAYVEADISNISVKVPGYIVQSAVVDNQHVNKGELLAQLEDSQFVAKLAQSKAVLASTQANLQTLAAKVDLQQALINQAKATVVASQSEQLIAQQQLKRSQKLKISNYSSQNDVDQLQAGFDSASAHVDEAQAALVAKQRELSVFNAQLLQVQADVDQAMASVELANIQLVDTRVTAPFAGIIGKRGAMVGQYVQPGQALFSLVPDAQVWITANFKETQIEHMQAGQAVKVSLDAYPDDVFSGFIDSLAPASGSKFSLLPAENATGNFTKIVQRIPVRIRLERDQPSSAIGRILPGLSAVVEVDTESATQSHELAKATAGQAMSVTAGH